MSKFSVILGAFAFCLAQSGCGKSDAQLGSERGAAVAQTAAAREAAASEEKANALKQLVLDELKDPGSAQFKELTTHEGPKGLTLCGQVNAKNSMGGYEGFQRFAAAERALDNGKRVALHTAGRL